MTSPSTTESAGKSLSTLTADGVAVLRVLRNPRTLPQIVSHTAQRGAPLGQPRAEAAVLAALSAGHVVPTLRGGEVAYERTCTGKRALKAAFRTGTP